MNRRRPGLADRQRHFDAGIDAGVVHVAAERARRAGGDRFLPSRRQADTSQHRSDRQLDRRTRAAHALSGRTTPLALSMVQVMRRASRSVRAFRAAGSTVYGRQQARGVGGGPIGLDLLERHHHRVAGFGALDIERAGLRIRPRSHRLAVPVDACGVDGLGDHAIARLDSQRRRVRAREGVVENRRHEPVRVGGENRRGRHERRNDQSQPTSTHLPLPPYFVSSQITWASARMRPSAAVA